MDLLGGFSNATNLEVIGDITMLLQDTMGGTVRDIPLDNYAFSFMFGNCTSLITTPSLPSTKLAAACYLGMFEGCNNLTTIPSLPSTKLEDICYERMFRFCSKIELYTYRGNTLQKAYRIPTSGTGKLGVDTTGSLKYMFTSTIGIYGGEVNLNTTYYIENQVI